MDPNVVTAIVTLAGLAVGSVTTYIALRKMPAEISSTESTTVRNLLESNKLLSAQLKQAQTDINDLRQWFTGTLEITNRIELTNPPRAFPPTVRRVPQQPDMG